MRTYKVVSFLLLLGSPLYFVNAIVWPMPKGFGGLFALFAEVLAANHYRLDISVPYYGPGGLPMAYPPLAIYLMAAGIEELHIPPLIYLRYFPAVISTLCLIPLYFLTKSFSKSTEKAFVSTLLFSYTFAIFIMHVYAGGVIRAVAFLFLLCGLWYTQLTMEKNKVIHTLLAGLCFALTALSHLGYLFFFALSLGVFTLMGSGFLVRLKHGATIFILGMSLSAPWWVMMVRLHGFDVFLNALSSHKTLDFMTALSVSSLFQRIGSLLAFAFFTAPILGGLVFSGLIWALLNKQWKLPLWFGFTLLISAEGWHFLVLIGAMLAGGFLYDCVSLLQERYAGWPQKTVANVFIGGIVLANVLTNLSPFMNAPAQISQATLDLGVWFQTYTADEAQYLFLSGRQDAAEWLPYFVRRTPAIGFWGSEWLGTYDVQYPLTLIDLPGCLSQQSLDCLEDLIRQKHLQVNYLVLPQELFSGALFDSLENSPDWLNVYNNPHYRVWQAGK